VLAQGDCDKFSLKSLARSVRNDVVLRQQQVSSRQQARSGVAEMEGHAWPRLVACVLCTLLILWLAASTLLDGVEKNYCIMTYMLQWPNVCNSQMLV
jgi:hypothetical protein